MTPRLLKMVIEKHNKIDKLSWDDTCFFCKKSNNVEMKFSEDGTFKINSCVLFQDNESDNDHFIVVCLECYVNKDNYITNDKLSEVYSEIL